MPLPIIQNRRSGMARPTQEDSPAGERPPWLRVKISQNETYLNLKELVHKSGLHTVCESAACPNMGECWANKALTFMILGNVCTRSCGFCDVQTGKPGAVDRDEPKRVAQALAQLDLNYTVVTSVDRDDLKDGGASVWAETIREIQAHCPGLQIEILTPDFKGDLEAVDVVLAAKPDVFAHNIETVSRLHRLVRPQAKYERSLAVLKHAHGRAITKSGVMLGLGETHDEVLETLRDLKAADVQIVNLGQYMRPSSNHLPVTRWVTPEEFAMLRDEGMKLGFSHVESGPLVRSSYRADKQAQLAHGNRR
jgi:lipoyl synthase